MTENEKINTTEYIKELSQKIFNKPIEDVKYLLVTHYIHEQLLEEELTRTGLYQWINVFKGEIKKPRDVVDYNEYDIVQVNMSAQDIHLIGNIRQQLDPDSNTIIVANNDYTSELWGQSFDYPGTIARELQYADMIFGTEYYQTSALSEITGREVFIIPHPADVKRLKSLSPIPKKNLISTVWRRYDNHSYVPFLAVRNHGMSTQLIGYDKNKDPKVYVTTALYDAVLQGTNYMDFCDQLRESKIVYDPFTFHSYSRTTVDTAALGVPVVVSNRTQSGNLLYPHTTVDPYDVTSARKLIDKLLNDEEFYELVVQTAYDKVDFYNHENSLARYLDSLDKALSNKENQVGWFGKKIEKNPFEASDGDEAIKELSKEKNRVKSK